MQELIWKEDILNLKEIKELCNQICYKIFVSNEDNNDDSDGREWKSKNISTNTRMRIKNENEWNGWGCGNN